MVTVEATNLDGFLELRSEARERILSELGDRYQTYNAAAEEWGIPRHHFYNYSRRDKKIHTSFAKALREEGLVNPEDFVAFYDDSGSSSFPYNGDFPITYSPRWHFVFCLCIGDGNFHKEDGKFQWFQKERGVSALREMIQDMGFKYDPSFESARHGVTLPRLIKKAAGYVLGIKSKEEAFERAIPASRRLGEDYEIALLTAFFVDEAGISAAKDASEITVHQEGNLEFLEKYGNLLDDFGVVWNKNIKSNGWVIRITSEGVDKLRGIFSQAEDLGFGLLHRRKAFDEKAEIARRTASQTKLRADTTQVRKRVLEGNTPDSFYVSEFKQLFQEEENLERRSKELLRDLESKGHIKKISKEQYRVNQ